MKSKQHRKLLSTTVHVEHQEELQAMVNCVYKFFKCPLHFLLFLSQILELLDVWGKVSQALTLKPLATEGCKLHILTFYIYFSWFLIHSSLMPIGSPLDRLLTGWFDCRRSFPIPLILFIEQTWKGERAGSRGILSSVISWYSSQNTCTVKQENISTCLCVPACSDCYTGLPTYDTGLYSWLDMCVPVRMIKV